MGKALVVCCVLLLFGSAFADQPSLVDQYIAGTAEDLYTKPGFCTGCSRPYTSLAWDTLPEEGAYTPANEAQLTHEGIAYAFLAADEKSIFAVDVARMEALLDAIVAQIDPAYRRKHVDSVTIILSSEDYGIYVDDWTGAQKRALLLDDLASYFTSGNDARRVGGSCLSFPGNDERERIIFLPVGKQTLGNNRPQRMHHCAYSYHISAGEDIILMSKLIHELTHALSLTKTLPSLEDYGFVPNMNWELNQKARGLALEPLYTVEALAYDVTVRVLEEAQPLAVVEVVHVEDEPQTTITIEEDISQQSYDIQF